MPATVQIAASKPAMSAATRPLTRGAGREAEIAPEAVPADRRGAPARMRHVADRRQERGVDHGGADPEQHRGAGPDTEVGSDFVIT